MSSTKTGKRYLSVAGGIVLLFFVVIGAVQIGPAAGYYDPYGFLFILIGGIALVLISFPGAEIAHAFRNSATDSSCDATIKNSAHFWEAAGRGFWLLGGLGSVLSIFMGFVGMASQQTAGIQSILPMLIRALLSTFYGSLLAVICFLPCWKIMGKLPSRPSAPEPEQSETKESQEHSGWRFGALVGYAIVVALMVGMLRSPHPLEMWSISRPSLLVVLGGTLALILFMGRNTRLTPSAAFAGMGFIGCLMGFIQMLHGMTNPSPQGIAVVAGALAFILFACFTALLGMALIGAPLEDRALRTGRAGAISGFSRISWYVFPLLSLIFLVVVFNMIILPLPGPR